MAPTGGLRRGRPTGFATAKGTVGQIRAIQPDWDDVGFYGMVKAVQPTPRGRRPKAAAE